MTQNASPPPTGLALSGGAVLGAAHVGVLRALEEEGIRTGWVVGASAGAAIAALHAFGLSVASRIQELSWLSVANLRPSRMGLFSLDNLAAPRNVCYPVYPGALC